MDGDFGGTWTKQHIRARARILSAQAGGGTDMRSRMTVTRYATSNGSYLIGADVVVILSEIAGISAVTVDQQFLDGANLSYQLDDRREDFARIDFLLNAKGMRRAQ
jgi:hypothetical protein